MFPLCGHPTRLVDHEPALHRPPVDSSTLPTPRSPCGQFSPMGPPHAPISSSLTPCTIRACTVEAAPWCCPSPSTSVHGTKTTVQLRIYPTCVWPHDGSRCPFSILYIFLSLPLVISLSSLFLLSLAFLRVRLLQRSLWHLQSTSLNRHGGVRAYLACGASG